MIFSTDFFSNKFLRRFFPGLKKNKPLHNQKGIALIMAVSALGLLVYIAMEVMYDSNVEYLVNSQQMNRLKAYYAARAGLDLSLLRIKIYQQVQQKLGKNAAQVPFLEQIWKFPLVWPLPISEKISSIEKDEIKKISKESEMDAAFTTKIEDEGSKIDLYDLVSTSKSLQETTKKQLLQIFEIEMKNNEEFRNRHSNVRFEELVNHIADWMSSKRESLNGGDKTAPYKEFTNSPIYPPNRGFRTLEEVRLVAGMTDEFFHLLEPRITIYGLKGINPNNASKEVLMSIDPGITEEIAKAILERIQDPNLGPFKGGEEGVKSFWSFVDQKGARLIQDPSKIPIVFDAMVSYRITSMGNFANAKSEITAVVMDLNKSATRTASFVQKEKKEQQANNGQPPGAAKDPKTGAPTTASGPGQSPSSQKQNDPLPKGPPRIVYWSEK